VVAEYAPTGREPDRRDEVRQAAYWAQVNAGRWQEALELDRRSQVVLCDSDPLKLHYSWSLARVGAASWSRFDHEVRHAQAAFAAGRLGLTDLVLVSIPSLEVLRQRQAGDHTRRRRSFDLHATLGEPLREWNRAVELADPGRVVWSFPTAGVPARADRRSQRSDPALLEQILEYLPPARRSLTATGAPSIQSWFFASTSMGRTSRQPNSKQPTAVKPRSPTPATQRPEPPDMPVRLRRPSGLCRSSRPSVIESGLVVVREFALDAAFSRGGSRRGRASGRRRWP
jgi:hypothetical protein